MRHLQQPCRVVLAAGRARAMQGAAISSSEAPGQHVATCTRDGSRDASCSQERQQHTTSVQQCEQHGLPQRKQQQQQQSWQQCDTWRPPLSWLHSIRGPASRHAYSSMAAAAAAAPPTATMAVDADDDGDPFASLGGLAEGTQQLTPSAIVKRLDNYIVGQADAKRAVAIAMRNRWRRHKLPPGFKEEVMPKNILMVGPTGCGKTEIARRLAKLADAPFVKVDASSFTELGYVGRDVEEIVKDLVDASIALTKQRLKSQLVTRASRRATQRILTALCGEHATPETLESFRQQYEAGNLDMALVDIDTSSPSASESNPMAAMFERLNVQPRGERAGRSRSGGAGVKSRLRVKDARSLILEQEAERWMSSEVVTREALRSAEQDGIVFIDEIDKIVEPTSRTYGSSGSVSSEGVQRDLLPILEGCQVTTKHGPVSTDHILFICSGAFHSSKPSDMLAELQGRLPIRVELKGLTGADFLRILTEPQHNMIRQQQVLLATEGVELQFTEGAVRCIASVAEEANRLLDNIGARRLHTVLERILSKISFNAPEYARDARAEGKERATYLVTEAMVNDSMGELLKKQDLSRYML